MSSLESSGFPSQLPPEGMEPAAAEPLMPLQPLQPFDEMQPATPESAPAAEPLTPLQPLNGAPAEHFQQPETLQYEGVQPLEPLQPPEPAMAPLPWLNGAEPVAEPAPAAPPQQSPAEIANLGVPLGTLIFRAGLLTGEQLEEALQEGIRTGKRLGEVLVESGLLDERDLGRLLADQKGLRFVELGSLAADPAVSPLLTAEQAHMFAALPIGFEDGAPLVAVADPSNELVTENLRRALGRDPRLVVASRSDLHAAIDRFHKPEAQAAPVEEEQSLVAEAAPVLEPVQVEHVPADPEPFAVEPLVVEPQPTALEPIVAEPVAPAAFDPPPAAEVEPLVSVVAEPVRAAVVAEVVEQPEAEQTFGGVEEEPAAELSSPQELSSALSYDVSLRLADGERVPIGSFGEPEKAREYAREVVKHLSEEADGWPFFSGRFLRPDTIVSVDIVPVGEPDRWLGSSVRSNWASRLNR